MYEVIFIILIIGLAWFAFNLQNSIILRNKREERRQAEAETRMRPNSEQRTIDLIGEEAYNDMTERIDMILRKHSHQQCVTVSLSCGPDTKEGATELHRILPGTQVQLNVCYEGGVSWIDVYNNGARIGRLALLDASTVNKVMKSNLITGAYVAEQNCYGIEDSCQLAVIIFYQPKNEVEMDKYRMTPVADPTPGNIINKMNICEN